MAGLNFQTCTVVNTFDSDKDVTFDNNILHIKNHGDFIFDKTNVVSVVNKEYNGGAKSKAEFTPTLDASKFYRLEVITDMEGAPVLTTSIPENGTSYWTEFTGVTKINDAIAKNLEKASIFGKALFNVTNDGGKLIIEAAGEYLRIKKVNLYELDYVGAPVIVATYAPTVKGTNSFGSYSHLIKDLRLPSVARAGIAPLHASEMPVVGGQYDQYIITYKAPASHNGMQAVGQKLENETVHVFWVNSGAKTAFDTAIKNLTESGTNLED